MKKILILIAIFVCAAFLIFFYLNNGKSTKVPVENKTETSNEIKVERPASGEKIQNPLIVTGEARGSWFFEGVFPAELLDGNGKSIGKGTIKAQGEWMTENFVQFKGEISFEKSETASGTLILRNDNPSGLPENQKEVKIPIKF